LVPYLIEARDLGFLGPGPVEHHLVHAAGFAAAVAAAMPAPSGPASAADLGSGAGLPGLALALEFVGCRWMLIDSSARRTAFLRKVVAGLGLSDRVHVREERAEETGRSSAWRGSQDLVVARSLGPPAMVAECAAPLLRVGGRLVVSEPPAGDDLRWSVSGLRLLGLSVGPVITAGGATFRVLHHDEPCGDRFPRRVGIPAKRPLF